MSVPRTVKGLSLVSLFNDFASEMVYPLLPAFVTGTMGGGALALGLLDGAADLTSALLKWVSGRLADRPGWRRPLILGGYATAVLVRPLISVAGTAGQVIGFRVTDRVGKGLRTPPRDALIAEVTPPALRGRAYGFHRGADHFGAVLGSVAAWGLLEAGADVRRVIGWSVVPGVVAFAVLAVVLRAAPGSSRRPGGLTPRPSVSKPLSNVSPLREAERGTGGEERGPGDAAGRTLWTPLLALAALTFFRLPETLLLLRLQQRGVPVALVPLIWAALHVVRSAASYPGGRLSDRWGPRATVAAGGVLFAACAAGLAVGATAASVIAVFLAFGVVAGLTESGERALVARLTPVRTGRGFGAYHAVTGIAALPAGLLFGALYQRAGGATALLASAIGMLAAVAAWLTVSPRHSRETIA